MPPKIQAWHANMAPTLHKYPPNHDTMEATCNARFPQIHPPPFQGWNKTYPPYHLEHIVLIFMALSTIASEQAHVTKNTMQKIKQLLDYLATQLEATVRIHVSDMILNIHSSILSIRGKHPQQNMWTLLNGVEIWFHTAHQIEWCIFHLVCNPAICCGVSCGGQTRGITSKLQTGNNFPTMLEEMGHPQPPMPIHCNNSAAVGIASNSVKWRQY